MQHKRLGQSLKWHERFRWVTFRLFEALSELRQPDAKEKPSLPVGQAPVESLWVFVSTIGELNAISTLLQRLLQERAGLQLVLISDHEHYEQAYLAKYPDAIFFHTRGSSRSARLLVQRFPPQLLIIGEIPCFPSEAPCRFSYAFLRTAQMRGASIALVNAWLYGESPACLMDKLEYRLLKQDYLDAIDLVCVQTDEIRDILVQSGMEPNKLHVTGNMKFDGLRNEAWTPQQSPSKAVLHPLIEGKRPIIVIGCMHNPTQQTLVIESFSALLETIPDALMIFAHRHPEVQRNLDKLVAELDSNNISYDHRSQLRDNTVATDTQCLILDTTGELKDFYAIAHVAYVGADHNLLEPLSFRKAVSTVSAWTKGLPNYPIFLLLRSAGAIVVADEKEALSSFWVSWLSEPDSNTGLQEKIDSVLRDAAGATEENIRLIELSDPKSSHIQQLR